MREGLDDQVVIFIESKNIFGGEIHGVIITTREKVEAVRAIIEKVEEDRERLERAIYRRHDCDVWPDMESLISEQVEFDKRWDAANKEIKQYRSRASMIIERLREAGIEFKFCPYYYRIEVDGW